MKKILGILGLLVFVCLFTTILNPDFISTYNIQNTLRWTSLFGIISIGVAFVIITSGIDLSIGSLVGLIGCLLPLALAAFRDRPPSETVNWTLQGTGLLVGGLSGVWLAALGMKGRWSEWRLPVIGIAAGAAAVVLGLLLPNFALPQAAAISLMVFWMIEVAVVIGLFHGLLITQVKLQPFVVTLCGLLYYRGLARWLADDQTQGFGTGYEGLKLLAVSRPCYVFQLTLWLGVAICVWAVWRLVRRTHSESPVISPLAVLLVGLILAVASGLDSRASVEALNELAKQSADAVAISRTQWTLLYTGYVGTLLLGVALAVVALIQKKFSVLASVPLTAIGVGLLVTVIYFDNLELWVRQYESTAGNTATVTIVDMTPARIPATIIGLMAGIGGAAWFLLTVWRGAGLWLRSAVFLAGVSVVLLLAGMTPIDRVEVPAPFLIMTAIALLAGFFLNSTIYGRYLLALGRNEEAARYSGINTGAMVILAYVICSGLAGVAGVLFALDLNSVQPSGHGNFYELYAIAAAVLGGCSLRGGEGSILGVVVGAAVMRVLYNAINILGISTQLEFTIIGVVILIGVVVDEMFKRIAEQRARKRSA